MINAQNRTGIRNSSQNMQRTTTTPAKMPEYDPAKAAGIKDYDVKGVLKKLKIKNDPVSATVQKAIENYNNEMNTLNLLHTGIFDELKMLVALTQKQAMETKDFSGMRETQKHLNATLEPIRKKVEVIENSLNDKLNTELSEDQFKRWVKYKKQKGKKKY
jgi:hypothetical protein